MDRDLFANRRMNPQQRLRKASQTARGFNSGVCASATSLVETRRASVTSPRQFWGEVGDSWTAVPSTNLRVGAPRRGRSGLRLLRMAAVLAMAGCGRTVAPAPSSDGWMGTWAAAQQLTEPRNLPPAPGLAGSTLRQVVQVSVGGERVRVRFSNQFGTRPLTLAAVGVAASTGASAIDVATDREVSFAGAASVTLAPGATVVSDPLRYTLPPLSRVAVTVHIADAPEEVTGHPGSRTTSYLQRGNAVSAPLLDGAASAEHWYLLAGIDVPAEGRAAVAVLGNSITDGRGSGTDRQNRWPDHLARRLQSSPRTARVAVLNMGIGGNRVLRGGLGPPALERFDRDVAERSGVRWLIVLEGVNDIGEARGAEEAAATARELIAAYRWMIARAHARGIRAYGATILPFGGSFYDSPEREAARQTVNEWIRTGGEWDAVIDLDAALRDPASPTRLRPEADTGDHLHPNEAGHRMMGEAVELALFAR